MHQPLSSLYFFPFFSGCAEVEAPKKAAATAVAAPKKAAGPAPAKPEATAAKPRILAPKKAETAAKADAHGAAKGGGGGGGGKGTTAKEAKGDKRPRAPSAYSLFADQMRPSLKGGCMRRGEVGLHVPTQHHFRAKVMGLKSAPAAKYIST